MSLLKPNLVINSVLDLPLNELLMKGYKGIIIDLDNTLTEWNSLTCEPAIEQWLDTAKRMGFSFCIVSNNGSRRVKSLATNWKIHFIPNAIKPRKRAFFRAIELMGTDNENTLVIGDQLFTDILGGNRAGLFTVLVNPLSNKEFIGTKIVRFLECIAYKRI